MTENEWKTRKERINKKLIVLQPSWKIIQFRKGIDTASLDGVAIEEFPTDHGPADYALFVKGKLLGIIEAKKISVNPQNVLEQAKRYAKSISHGCGEWNGFKVPFLYATNGEIIHFIDIRREPSYSRTLAQFHTPDALHEFYHRQERSSWFKDHPLNIAGLRPYQIKAVQNTEQAIIDGKRSMLIAQATGTGKTFTAVSLAYRLIESGLAKRILFLVDRRALASQTITAFHAFLTPKGNKFSQEYEIFSQRFRREDFEENEPFDPQVLPPEYLQRPALNHTYIYVSTIQRMAINVLGPEHAFYQSGGDTELEEDVSKINIPIHAFDIIIADECHRGYTAKDTATWRQVLDHFDAIKIGLTATPAAHTLAIFNEVVSRYTTEEAIKDGWLVDYDVVKIKSGVKVNGLFLKEGERVGMIDTQTGIEKLDELEDEREFDSSKIEKEITAEDSNRKIIEEVAKYAYQHEQEKGRFPKILIFAENDLQHTSHADQIVRLCRQVFKRGDSFVQKITGSPNVDRPLQRIKEFRNRPEPMVVVTVDMLSTGVDIPKLEFLVFLRIVKSRILWVQMLGRGTRLCPEINKESFTIFDCFDGTLIQYFKNATDFNLEDAEAPEVVSIKEVIENIYQNVDRDYNVRRLVKRLHRIDRSMSGKAREKFAAFIPDGDLKKFASELPRKLEVDFAAMMILLRNEAFQDLLVNYERAPRVFFKAYGVEDEVTSEVIIRRGQEHLKPDDYLNAFARFVQQKTDEIEALQILIKNPKKWRAEPLKSLRRELIKNDYPIEELQKAHKFVSHKALADIISIVKYAAKRQEPILTAQERVDHALAKVSEGKSFNEDQQKWLGQIREHLIQNLSLEEEDFIYVPIFEMRGGLAKAQKVFEGRLKELIDEINYHLAA